MSTSILNDVKHHLGLLPDDPAFDLDLVNYINAQFANLTQLGVGPVEGYKISGPGNLWDEFYTDPRLDSVRVYIYLKVKLVFDPPGTGFVLASFENQIKELEYRINVVVDFG